MKRRLLTLLLGLVALVLVGCQSPQDFGPRATDVDLWERHDIRPDTEVPNQYPDGLSGLTRSLPEGTYEGDTNGDDTH